MNEETLKAKAQAIIANAFGEEQRITLGFLSFLVKGAPSPTVGGTAEYDILREYLALLEREQNPQPEPQEAQPKPESVKPRLFKMIRKPSEQFDKDLEVYAEPTKLPTPDPGCEGLRYDGLRYGGYVQEPEAPCESQPEVHLDTEPKPEVNPCPVGFPLDFSCPTTEAGIAIPEPPVALQAAERVEVVKECVEPIPTPPERICGQEVSLGGRLAGAARKALPTLFKAVTTPIHLPACFGGRQDLINQSVRLINNPRLTDDEVHELAVFVQQKVAEILLRDKKS